MKDLKKLTEAIYLLDSETREALEAHGGPYEFLNQFGKWESTSDFGLFEGCVYRVKHAPLEGWFNVHEDVAYGPYSTEAIALYRRSHKCTRTIFMREVTE
jgi:hypothetical protein